MPFRRRFSDSWANESLVVGIADVTLDLRCSIEREKTRGPLNIQRLYGKQSKEWLIWDVNTFALLRQDSELTKKQIQVAKQMAELPQQYQVDYWKQNFQPLQQDEELLRQKLEIAQKSIPK